jgi:hypothetical protein
MRVTPPIVVIHHDVFPTVPFLSTGDISLNWNRTPATAIETAFISFGLILTGMAVGLVVEYSESAVEAAVEMEYMIQHRIVEMESHETTSMAKLTNTRAKRSKTEEVTPVEAGKMVVSWSDPHSALGDCGVESSQVIKCQPHEFVEVGDSVKAAYDLDYGKSLVKQGSLGVVRSLLAGKIVVSWSEPHSTHEFVESSQVIKCQPHEFVEVGDSVKAAYDLDYGKSLVKQGSLGVVRSLLAGKIPVVSWSDPHSALGDCSVESSQVIKCQPHEFVKVGDSVKAAYDLDYGEGLVKQGSLGVVRSLPTT